jgi:hypothetical protein
MRQFRGNVTILQENARKSDHVDSNVAAKEEVTGIGR